MRGIPRRYCASPDCGCDDIEAETCHQRREAPEVQRSRLSAKQKRHKAQRLLAFASGEMFADAGLSRDLNPHPEGSALWISWNAGWKGAAR